MSISQCTWQIEQIERKNAGRGAQARTRALVCKGPVVLRSVSAVTRDVSGISPTSARPSRTVKTKNGVYLKANAGSALHLALLRLMLSVNVYGFRTGPPNCHATSDVYWTSRSCGVGPFRQFTTFSRSRLFCTVPGMEKRSDNCNISEIHGVSGSALAFPADYWECIGVNSIMEKAGSPPGSPPAGPSSGKYVADPTFAVASPLFYHIASLSGWATTIQ
ncbi:hypothetical protein C8F04DRAFT_1253338 [Mycena alexandri]|uniref:Uncharacterized protein n=1 Tax=Mycena alexandri TaxID=1745969 RepID=A0AAD6TC82_9AGAR|nr:hypothetical protein C8F04DRAFT_1253338 [Mycena alexandri]